MSAIAPPLRPRLGKLVPLLGSDKDGEVLGTVRAIGRVLHSGGADWHSLAAAIEHEPRPRVVYVQPMVEPNSWRDLARWIRDNDRGRLAAHERKFVTDLVNRLVLNGKPTEKQAAWLRGLYVKLGGASA